MNYIAICSEQYLKYYQELYNSIKKHSPTSKQTLYYIGPQTPTQFDQVVNITDLYNNCNQSYNTLERICSLRAKVVLESFKTDDHIIFCGAKIKFFADNSAFENLVRRNNAVVTPHITIPLPEDGKFPSNASVSNTGHISTDLIGFRKSPEIIKFLEWQDQIMKPHCKTTNYTYLDQSWLNFLPFFVNGVYINKSMQQNCAYWNFKQRDLRKINNKWMVGNGVPLISFQFSGLDLNNPVNISTHQNRYKAEGDFLEFLEDYAKRAK